VSTEGPTGNGQRLEGVRVLLVDDDPDTLEATALTLEHYGATVIRSQSAPRALEVLERERPDVLLSDIAMPGQSGFELIARVRALPPERGGRVPAAALTAFSGPADQERVLAAGFTLHIPKPVEATQLVMAIAALVGRGTEQSEPGSS
jgi:CheY-like chemotaxis protein